LFSCFSDKISCITLYSSATNLRHLFIRGINRNVVKIRGSTLFATSAPLRGIKARLPAVGSAVVGNSLFRVFGVFRGSNFGCGFAAPGFCLLSGLLIQSRVQSDAGCDAATK
jgi:hypothetical protein